MKKIIAVVLTIVTIAIIVTYYYTSTKSGLSYRLKQKYKAKIASGEMPTFDEKIKDLTVEELKHLLENGGT